MIPSPGANIAIARSMRARQNDPAQSYLTGREATAHSHTVKKSRFPLIDVWHDSPLYLGAVQTPVLSILLLTCLVITSLPVDEERSKVEAVEVRDNGWHGVKATRKAPTESHDPIAEVVDMPAHAPPAADDKLGASCSG